MKGIKHICSKSELDDVTVLKSFNNSLLITGSNSISVLFAAYRYLNFTGPIGCGRDKTEKLSLLSRKLRQTVSTSESRPRIGTVGNLDHCLTRDYYRVYRLDGQDRMYMFLLTLKTSQAFYNRDYAGITTPLAKPLPEISRDQALKRDDK